MLFFCVCFVILLLPQKKSGSSTAELSSGNSLRYRFRPDIYDIEKCVVLEFVTVSYQSCFRGETIMFIMIDGTGVYRSNRSKRVSEPHQQIEHRDND